MTETDDNAGNSDSDRWLTINGRRWRRTDFSLPLEVVEQLKSHLGRGRSGVRVAKANNDEKALASARARVDTAKQGLGERGAYWWEQSEDARLKQALDALDLLNSPHE